MVLSDPNLEGFNIVQEMLRMFWNRHELAFKRTDRSTGADDEGRYFAWPVAIGVQAVVDAARVNPHYKELVEETMQSLGAFYDVKKHAYTASNYFDGNNDIYYDDNAQLASALITAFEVTGDKRLLDLGRDNVHFLMTGAGTKYGGVRWHVEKEVYNTVSAAEVGIAVLRLARHSEGREQHRLIEFAKNCHDWLFEKMQDKSDNLFFDGIESDGSVNQMKWSYNQGTPITLSALLYNFTNDEKYFEAARSLAKAAADPGTAIFDRDTPNYENRYYRDSLKFYQLLVEGFADYLLFFGEKDPETAEQIMDVVNRHLFYIYSYLRLPNDRSQYNGTLELFRLDEARYEIFKKMTAEDKNYEPQAEEREDNDVHKEMAANFMNMASAARVFFQSARIVPKVKF